jgi:hypothetical protein
MKLRELERRLEEEPDNLVLRITVAGALREAGRDADAVELYRSVAIAYRDQGRTQQAIAVCRSILEVAPDDARCHALLAALGGAGTGTPDGERGALRLPLPASAAVAAPRTMTRPPGAFREREPESPPRRAATEETPLPPALPHHVADPTLRVQRISESDLPTTEGAPTRPGSEVGLLPEVSGIANAARRISARLISAHPLDDEEPSVEIYPLGSFDDGDAIPDDPDDDTDDDQTMPRELPLGLRRARPPSLGGRGPAAPGALAFAFFAPLPVERRAAVLARFSRRSVPPRTVVIRQGEVAPSLVLVSSGRLEVRAEQAGAATVLGAVGPGEYIGEVPLLARAPARAAVVATTEAELLLLSPRDFYEIAGTFPALWAALKETAARRTREHDARR